MAQRAIENTKSKPAVSHHAAFVRRWWNVRQPALYYDCLAEDSHRSAGFAVASGVADVLNGWADVLEPRWPWTTESDHDAFLRDRLVLAGDFWRALAKAAPETVLPGQQKLFDDEESG